MGKTGGANTDGVLRGGVGGGGHVADRGAHPKRGKGVQRDRVSRVHVEGRGGDITSPAHDSDFISRHATRLPGGSRYWYFHPLGQALTTACGHEGGSSIRDLLGPEQGV